MAIGVAIALVWQVLRPPRTFEGFALRLLTAAGLLTIFTLLRDPSSLAIVGAPRFLLPGASEASAQARGVPGRDRARRTGAAVDDLPLRRRRDPGRDRTDHPGRDLGG
ncbi:MAG: hypothetical protein U0470_02330 [Anaerolineae bacterium]